MFYYPVNKTIFNEVEREKKVDYIDCNDDDEFYRSDAPKIESKINKVIKFS